MVRTEVNKPIAMILGGSTGLGAATAKKLAAEGFDLLIVHRDRKSDMQEINSLFDDVRKEGALCYAFNADAVTPAKQKALWSTMKEKLGTRKIKVLIHSIAKGNLKPMSGGRETLSNMDFQLTIQAMATSLYDWVRLIADDNCFEEDARIMAFTSEGSTKAMANYGAVSAAKASLEAIIRNIALEFAPMGIKANCIQAGVVDTKSTRMIPNADILMAKAKERNPNNRLTRSQDVANVTYLLTLPEANWITGTIIKTDGGESLQ